VSSEIAPCKRPRKPRDDGVGGDQKRKQEFAVIRDSEKKTEQSEEIVLVPYITVSSSSMTWRVSIRPYGPLGNPRLRPTHPRTFYMGAINSNEIDSYILICCSYLHLCHSAQDSQFALSPSVVNNCIFEEQFVATHV
jgi:hypothetical protein